MITPTTSSQAFNLIASGSLEVNKEISSLTPSTMITFYEIDLSQISPTIISSTNFSDSTNQPITNGIFRIYNDYNLYKISTNPYGAIKWQNNIYYPFPVQAEGFEYTTAGTLPVPRVIIANFNPNKTENSFFNYIRMQIESFGDIVGSKFTRIRTFIKFLDPSNWENGVNPYNNQSNLYEMELPKDIFYVDRKSLENKELIEYELSASLDLEALTLPGRTIYSKKCPFQYRGEGCCYEYNSRLSSLHSGVYGDTVNPDRSVKGLLTAPPVASINDQLFIGGVFPTGAVGTAGNTAINRITGGLGDKGAWAENINYVSGDFTYIQKNGLSFYYVCINNHTSNFLINVPPNKLYWIDDSCSKTISSCRLRWLYNPAFRPVIWPTNRGGWDSTMTHRYLQRAIYNYGNLAWVTGDGTNYFNFPRRPGCEDPTSTQSYGLPKDANGNYLNGFLPFGGFPGTKSPGE